jgi:CDP-2,3-bis-(O-geranylgeranyl)-sn-glycerol synthase
MSSMSGVLAVLAQAVWAMLPAYIPNNVAVLAGGGRPIDAGRSMGGRRLLGDGKTWRGTIVGTAAGTVLAVGLDLIAPTASSAVGADLAGFPVLAGFTLALGAMLGDITASFLKRRLGRQRGASVPGLDQLDFVIGALALTAVVVPSWFGATFTLPVIAAVLVVTPLLHLGTNGIAYGLGLKNEPW